MNLPLVFYIAGAFVILVAVGIYVLPLLEKLHWEVQERQRADRDELQTRDFMRQQRKEQLPRHLGTQGVDLQLEEMRAQGRSKEALSLARERLRMAHEQGDRKREELYRFYMDELTQSTSPPQE